MVQRHLDGSIGTLPQRSRRNGCARAAARREGIAGQAAQSTRGFRNRRLAFFGAYVLLNLTFFYFAIPRLKGMAGGLYEERAGHWGFWLMSLGVLGMSLSFAVAGVLQPSACPRRSGWGADGRSREQTGV